MSRPNDLGGVLRRLTASVGGHEVAALRPNERAVLTLAPGHHVVHGEMDWTCSRQLELDLAEDDSAAVEVSLPFSSVLASFIAPKTAVKIRQTS